MTEKTNDKQKSVFLKIISAQCIFVTVLLLSILIIKFTWSNGFGKIQKWYTKNLTTDTRVSEVLDGTDYEI